MGVVFLTNASALATRQRFRARAVNTNTRVAALLWANAVKARAQQLSQGPLSTAELRRRGHPYAVRFQPGAAGQPDYIVNRQTGRFAASWQSQVWGFSGHVTATVWNSAPESRYMVGTRLMRMRPILEAARGQLSFTQTVAKAKRQAEGGGSDLPIVGFFGMAAAELVRVGLAVGATYADELGG